MAISVRIVIAGRRVRVVPQALRHLLQMDILLRERDLNAVVAECLVNGKVEITEHLRSFTDVAHDDTQFKVQRTGSEGEEQHARFRPVLIVAHHLRMRLGNLK